MAFHRKLDAALELRPDIAVISECAARDVLAAKGDVGRLGAMEWIGDNTNKGLAVFARRGYEIALDPSHDPTLRHIAPLHVTGPVPFRLLAVWAQNFSGGITRKDQPGPFRLGLDHYRRFLTAGDAVVAGDLNNNAIWDRPGWPINHLDAVEILAGYGLVSAYHELRSEKHGAERTPTIYWRDRKLRGPRYHLDYIFVPRAWLPNCSISVGSFRKWVATGQSDHVPVVLEHRQGDTRSATV